MTPASCLQSSPPEGLLCPALSVTCSTSPLLRLLRVVLLLWGCSFSSPSSETSQQFSPHAARGKRREESHALARERNFHSQVYPRPRAHLHGVVGAAAAAPGEVSSSPPSFSSSVSHYHPMPPAFLVGESSAHATAAAAGEAGHAAAGTAPAGGNGTTVDAGAGGGSRGGTDAIQLDASVEERYSPRSCKYRSLPRSLNSLLEYNGEIHTGDVFGLPASSLLHEQRITFTLPQARQQPRNIEGSDSGAEGGSSSSAPEGRRAILSVSVEMHRDSVAEFNYLELYRRRPDEQPPPLMSAAEAAAAADGAGAVHAALRRRQAIAVGRRVEGAGGTRTKIVLTAALSDDEKSQQNSGQAATGTIFELIFSFRDSLGRLPATEEGSSVHSPLLPCFPVRVDLALVPLERMPLHMPSSCPTASRLPPESSAPLVLQDEPLQLSNPAEAPFAFVFSNSAAWPPYSLAVWKQTLDIPRRLHRFVHLFFRLSFRFLTGPMQLLLELFDEKSRPDETAAAPECLLGCLGGTPTFNGQLFDHAMPTGFTYKIWILAGEPMYLDHHSTHCAEFDFEYVVQYEARLTPFEVRPHAWLCRFARLPLAIEQIPEGAAAAAAAGNAAAAGVAAARLDRGAAGEGLVRARSVDLKDWFGFPVDEIEEMLHFVDLYIYEPSDVRAAVFKSKLRLRVALLSTSSSSAWSSSRNGEQQQDATAAAADGRVVCSEKKLAGQAGDGDAMLRMHCRLPAGHFRLVLYAEYPLGGIAPCDGFYMHFTLRPLALLNERYGCKQQTNQQQLPPLLLSPQGPPPLAMPPVSHQVIDLGRVEESTLENFRSFSFEETPPTAASPSAFSPVAAGNFSVQSSSASQIFLHVTLLSDFAAADLTALVRRRDAAADAADDYVLSFSHDFQHLVGPLDAGDYRLELVSLSAQTVDDAVAKEVAEPLCLPFLLDLRLLRRAGDDLHSATWSCSQQVPHLPRYIRGEAGLQMTLDKEFRLPTNGHHTVHLFIPKHSILKLHVHSPHSGEPRLSIAAKDTPQENLANAYEDLFLEADAEGDYLVRMQFPAAAGVRTTQPLCPTVQLHLVLIPRGDVPRCPWARGHQQLDAATLRLKAEEQVKAPALADFFRPRGIAEQKLETEAPVDLWLSPSLREAEFSFSTHTVSTSVRVEIVLHPPWLPARLLLFRKDNGVLRRTPEATAQVVQNRLLLLAPDVSSGDFLVQLKIFDEVDLSTEHLCAHATLHAEIGAADETSLNALRAELLGLPELLPAEPPPTSFNRRGWLSLPDTPVIATSIFRFGKKAPRDPAPTVRLITGAAALSEQSPQGGSDGAAATTGRAAGEIRREEAVDATELTRTSSSNERVAEQRAAAAATAATAAETTLLKVEKPTLLRVVAEPAVLSQDKLQLQLRESSASGVAQQPHLAEEAENALLALLLPGKTYQLQYAASAPFLLTIGISSVEQLRRDMMSAPLVLPSSSSSGGGSSADCLSSMPELSLPTPLPHFFESETFDIRLDPSFLQRKDDIATVPITLSTACVIYVEAVSNFFLDYVKVAVRVEEGTWIGEQHGQANFLRLLLDPGQHNIRIYRGVAANALHSEDAITQGIDIERCLHFSLKIKAVALTYAGPSTAVEAGQGCFSYGALPLPLDFHSRDGGSAALGGPIDSEGRLLVRSKIVIPEGAGRRSVALDTRGKNVVLKVGIFAEDRSRLLLLQVKDGHSLPLTPAMEWAVADGGYERVFELDGSRRRYGGENSSVFHLDFRVEQSGLVLPSACLVFDLVVQTMPLADKQRMSACSGAGMPQPQLPEDFFPRAAVAAAARQSASHETGLQQHVWSPFSLVTEAAEGFLTEIPFALTEESFVVAEVRYNFFASHIEVDLLDNSSHPAAAHKHGVPLPAFSEAETIAGGELDFVGRGRDPLNVRQWIATQLMPGHYVLRVADDHYAPHFMTAAADGTQRHACYPMEFRFQVYSLVAAVQQQRRIGSSSSGTAVGFAALPAPGLVLGIHPDPSLPVKYGQDLLILLRLSTPPSVPTRRGKAPAAGAAKEQEAAVAAAERSAYLVGESGFKLHASQFVNIDVAADEHQGQKVKQLQQGWKEKAKDDDVGDEAEEEGEGGLVWSFLFPAEQVERLGNKAKFRLEFKTKSAAADYLFSFPEPGVQTPQLWSAGNSNSNSGSNRDARKYVEEVEFTFLSPGALQENVPWHGMEGAVLPTWLQQQQQASPADFSAQDAGVPRREDPRQQQPTRGQEASTVAPAAFQQPPQQQSSPGAPLTPPKVPRASLIVEEDEEEDEEDAERHLQQETGKKPPRAVPWERHRQPWETQPERKEGQSWTGKGADGRPHADPYYIEESEFEPTCAEGMRWNDETGDCERAPTADKPPSALLVLLVSAAGVGGLLLVSHYALRRRRKGVSRAEAEGTFAMTRLNSDDYDQLDFLHHRYNSGPVLRRGLNEDEV